MGKVQGLNKQFTEKDVKRMRNLIQGKHGEKTGQSVGYAKKDTHYKEGDVWEQDGRKWTIKEGIKQNITKLDAAKKAHLLPIFCPNCGSKMHSDLDKPYYNIHKKCFNCVVEFEHHLKTSGLYETYVKKINNADIDGVIEEFKAYIESELTLSNNSFITEQGDVEKWNGGPNVEKVLEGLSKTIEHLQNMKSK
jgi:hypothetical protein|tara:strand:+ start:643 stop:1221 length:579 start_codon:yes stop_codon:yes gene_type:complete